MVKCFCGQIVINREEQSNKRPMCYFHVKVREKLISLPHDYTIANFETVLSYPVSDPNDYHKAGGTFWEM